MAKKKKQPTIADILDPIEYVFTDDRLMDILRDEDRTIAQLLNHTCQCDIEIDKDINDYVGEMFIEAVNNRIDQCAIHIDDQQLTIKFTDMHLEAIGYTEHKGRKGDITFTVSDWKCDDLTTLALLVEKDIINCETIQEEVYDEIRALYEDDGFSHISLTSPQAAAWVGMYRDSKLKHVCAMTDSHTHHGMQRDTIIMAAAHHYGYRPWDQACYKNLDIRNLNEAQRFMLWAIDEDLDWDEFVFDTLGFKPSADKTFTEQMYDYEQFRYIHANDLLTIPHLDRHADIPTPACQTTLDFADTAAPATETSAIDINPIIAWFRTALVPITNKQTA